MRSSNFSTALLVAIILVLGAPLCSAAASAKLHLSATVTPFLSFNAIQNVTTYQINSEDIKRGYVDLPNAITLQVRTNLNAGVPVMVENSGTAKLLFKESGRSGFAGNAFTVDSASYRFNTPIRKSYDSRIILSTDAQEGSFPLLLFITPAI